MIGHEIGDLKSICLDRLKSCSNFQRWQIYSANGQTTIRANDEVSLSRKREASKVVNEMRKKEEPIKMSLLLEEEE